MTREEAITHGKEQLEVFGGEHREFIEMAIKALEQEPCKDAISREAVLDIVRFENKWLFDARSTNVDTGIAFNGIISKVSDLPPVQSKVKTDVLDKIRAEIEAEPYISKMEMIDIIDKYKAESEDKK